MLHTNTTTGSADLGAIVDGLDLDNELFGLTEDDDGKSVSLVGTSAPATIIEDESTDAPVIAVATLLGIGRLLLSPSPYGASSWLIGVLIQIFFTYIPPKPLDWVI